MGYEIYTKSLLHFDGSDGSTTFTDEIGNIWTPSGTAQIDTAQSKFGGASILLDGVDDYIYTPSSLNWRLDGEFTIEFWIYPNSWPTAAVCTIVNTLNGFQIGRNGSQLGIASNITAFRTSGTLPTTGVWSHIAFTRDSSNNLRYFLNGNLDATSVYSGTFVEGELRIGYSVDSVDGWMDEFRISKGVAKWTSSFTPPVSPYYKPGVDDIYTKSLLHCDGNDQNNIVIDESGKSWAMNGDASILTTQYKFGEASLNFDGTGDYITGDGSSDFAIGTNKFTIDFWFRVPDTVNKTLVDFRPVSTNGLYPTININSSVLEYYTDSLARITGTTTINADTWYHCALSRDETSTRLFLDGVQEGSTYTDSNNYLVGSSRPILYTDGTNLSNNYSGWIDEFRFSKNIARWTANFTPPISAYLAGLNWVPKIIII